MNKYFLFALVVGCTASQTTHGIDLQELITNPKLYPVYALAGTLIANKLLKETKLDAQYETKKHSLREFITTTGSFFAAGLYFNQESKLMTLAAAGVAGILGVTYNQAQSYVPFNVPYMVGTTAAFLGTLAGIKASQNR